MYQRRKGLLLAEPASVTTIIRETIESVPESRQNIDKKRAELGEDVANDLIRRGALQMMDMLWVEHLEVMAYTRSSVNLRAYGQRDPLIEYRKEGVRLFQQMNDEFFARLAKIIPLLQPQAVIQEEEQRKAEAAAAQKQAGITAEAKKSTRQQPAISATEFSRNELVTISNGTDTQTVKYKKAEPLLTTGWVIKK
jgi:preprotein translocase subunit SecA